MSKIYLAILFQFSVLIILGQNYNLHGFVQEDISKEPIGLVNVFLQKSKLGTASTDDGAYQLSIPDSLFNDTLVISAIGYKEQKICVTDIYPEENFTVLLQDSMFLLDEVVAFCYDYIEGLYWKSKTKEGKDYLLTFISKDISNVSNFVLLLNERFGKGKKRRNTYVWKNISIPGLEGHTKIMMKFFRCGYCPNEDNITVTFYIDNSKIKEVLKNDEHKLVITNYFQEILDQTFENGINISQLEKRKRIYYLPEAEEPYTGKVYGYFESGQKGLRGQLYKGKKDQKWEYWFKNNQKRMVVYFNKGGKEGLWVSWYKNGDLRIKNTYKNNRLVSNNFWWYENGSLKKVSFYKNGIIQGKVEWEEGGELKEKRGIFENTSDTEIENIQKFKFEDKKIANYILKFM